MGRGDKSGGNYSTTGASYRLIFKPNRGAAGYLYPQLKQAWSVRQSGDQVTWDVLDQSREVQNAGYIATGVHMFAAMGKRTRLAFKSGQWNDVEMYCKLNTPGRYDGIMELAINGQRERLTTVRYRYTRDVRIEAFHLSVFFGGDDPSYAPSQDVRIWYADFAFASS